MRQRFFARLFVTSLVNITIIVLGLFIFLQFSFLGSIRRDIQDRDQEVLIQIQKRIDENLIAMRRIALSISISSAFSPFYLPDDPMKAIEGIQNLRSYALISTDLSLVGIAYRNSRYALSDKGSILKDYFTLYDLPDYLDMSDQDALRRGFIVRSKFITFLYPYPVDIGASPQGVIFVSIQTSSFALGVMERMDGHKRYLTISNPLRGDTLFTNKPTEIEDFTVSEYTSAVTGYRYEIATPSSYFESALGELRLISLLVLLGLLCIGIFLNWGIARYNALPLRRLLGKFGPDRARMDEDFESVETILVEQRTATERAARDIFLLDLMRGSFGDKAEMREKAADVGFAFTGPTLAFLVAHSEASQDWSIKSRVDEAEYPSARFYRQRVLSGENEVWVFCGAEEALGDETLQRFKRLAYSDASGCTIGVGNPTAEPRYAAQSFLEALTAVNFRLIRGRGGIIHFQSLPKTDTVEYARLDGLLNELKATLAQHDSAGAAAAVSAVLDLCSDISISSARYILWRLLQPFDDQDLIRNGIPVRQMAAIDGVPELLGFVRGQTENALARLSGNEAGTDNDMVNEIKTYVEIHFDDRNLSLDSISDALGYSVGYLCRVFKLETGTTVSSYIQEMRVREACRLLRTTDLPVKDIVHKIGYMDHPSFSRSFKAQMGASPQDYRSRSTG